MRRINYLAGLILTLCLFGLESVLGQTVLLDDFNRTTSTTVGNGWGETETVATTGAAIAANTYLSLGSTTAGRDYIWRDVSTNYNTVFNTNTSVMTWMFNMRQSRPDPSGFDASNYGVAFVLGCNSSNFLTGSGYAVVLGNSGTTDNIRLVRFAAGMSPLANITQILAPPTDFGSEYHAIKVTYNPVGNSWSLYVSNNGTTGPFIDPNTVIWGAATTGSDGTYTGTDLMFLGCLWNHATGGTEAGYFDNIYIPNACTVNPEPSGQASAPNVTGIGANSMTLNWTRGNGTECIVIMHQNGAVTTTPADGSAYIASATFGSGTMMATNEYVVYMGSGTSCTVNGLNPNTSYSFSVFEFNGTGCTTNFLLTTPANNSATTIGCVLASEPTVQSSGLTTSSALSNSIQLSWTRGNGAFCVLVCKGISAVTTPPVDGIVYTANAAYGLGSSTAPGEYVVYLGTGTSTTVTGLLPGFTYYFAVFEMNGSGCNSNYLSTPMPTASASTVSVPSYNNYFGNLHAHSDYSDGDVDNICNGANSPTCCYTDASTALYFDYMGISDHNHNEGPVMTPAKYASGLAEATAYMVSNPSFVAFYGMEWGTISTGGHLNVYGINQLLGWNTGNYNVYVAKGDYNTVFNTVAATPNAFATLCHPNATDFGNIKNSPYNATYDNAIVGVAVKNGPAFSTNTSYTDPAASNTVSYFKDMLAKGYHLGPLADMDNHYSATMGKSNQGRTVILAPARTKAAMLDGILNMRFYATEDYNFQVGFNANGNLPMGSIVVQTVNPTFTITSSDPDGESTTQIRLWYGVPGSNLTPTVLASNTNSSSLTFTHSFATGTYYYYAEITQADGNVAWTSPIWYTKITSPLPIELLSFTGKNTWKGNVLDWKTASEINNSYFTLERSYDTKSFEEIAKIDGAGNSSETHDYTYLDRTAKTGLVYYRLKQTDFDGTFTYSNTIALRSADSKGLFTVYPNPNEGTFTLTFTGNDDSTYCLQIFNALGACVFTTAVSATTSSTFYVPELSAGVYTVHLSDGQDSFIQRMMIQQH
ncbi:MAG: T9SS type A sorting domain-containing protein [Bacteroidetes bacterium]|nr:T9SS type A sorting domain-containing protein [Bacteroidota bacterium]